MRDHNTSFAVLVNAEKPYTIKEGKSICLYSIHEAMRIREQIKSETGYSVQLLPKCDE